MSASISPSVYVNWRPEDEILVKRYISALMGILAFDETGNSQTTEGQKLEKFIRILINYLNFSNELSHTWEIKHGLIYKAIFKLKREPIQDIFQFQRILAKEVEQYLCLPIRKYKIIFPLHGKIDNVADNSCVLLGEKLEFRNWVNLREEIKTEDFLDQARIFLHNDAIAVDELFTPILMISEGRNEQEAFDRASRIFELFRTLLNVLTVQFHHKRQWGGYPTAYSEFLSPPVFGLFEVSGEFVDLFYNETKYLIYKDISITKELVEGVQKLAVRLLEPVNDDDSIKIFIEALDIYGQAIDTAEWRFSFILLWQVFEILTLKSKDVPEFDVIRRVAGVMNLSQHNQDLLQVMYSSRNLLIHESKFPSGNSIAMNEFSFLKTLVDRFIPKAFDLVKKYPIISHLSNYYDNFALSKRKKN